MKNQQKSNLVTDSSEKEPKYIGKIIWFDPEFENIIPKTSKIENLAGGFKWCEGPIWIPKENRILFSDIPGNAIYSWKEGDGISVFLKPSGYTGTDENPGNEPGSNGLTIDSEETLYICCHGDRNIKKMVNAKPVVVVDKYKGKRFNSPNDLAFHKNGDLYFTDPPYGLPKLLDDPDKELDWCGVYRYSNGETTLLTRELTLPNGLAFSLDYKTLYVTQSDYDAPLIKSFPVKEDGTLGKSSIFIDTNGWGVKETGAPDGMLVDNQERIWTVGPGGVLVYTKDAKLLGQLNTGGEQASNCTFGNDNYLYITLANHLCRVKTNVKQ